TAEEEVAGRDRVVILSHASWQRRFASSPGVIGRIIHVDGEPTVVVGILPPAARFVLPGLSANTEIFVPPTRSIMVGRRVPTLQVVGRLKPDVSLGQARAEMDALAAHLKKESPRANANVGIRVVPLVEEITGAVRPALALLLSAVGCVLLIACGNVANLLLAHTAARGRELGVRAVLGAGRARLTRQLLTESLLLAGTGGLAGVLISSWGARALVALTPPGLLPRSSEVGLDWRVALFGLGLSLAAGAFLGLAPAFSACRLATHGNLAETLKAASAGSTTVVRGQRLRRALIVGEVALSLMLLAAAGLLIRSFIRLRAVDLGFRPENLLIATVTLPQSRYKEPAQRGVFAGQVLERLHSAPGIEAAAFTNSIPLAARMSFATSISIEGRADKEDPIVSLRTVTPDYFRAVGVPLKRGRLLSDSDGAMSDAVLINESMARRFWPPGSPDSDPVGRRIRIFQGWRQVAGVVGDVRSGGLKSDPVPEIYAPMRENPLPVLTLVVRTPAEPMTLVPSIRAVVRSIDADLPLERVGTMERVLYSTTAGPRFQMTLIAVFAAIALALAAIGLYGVISYSVAQRTRELGIRMALGAERADVLGMVLRQGMTLAVAGVALGLAGALGAGKLLATFLFGVKPADPVT
ncbi:MAG: ADOP family duplicated permease, partial [Candidatus Sumerlaeota bacterium]|nr:ADOP family duplicated permease [Candidatus Sumerlaeota bacterium]